MRLPQAKMGRSAVLCNVDVQIIVLFYLLYRSMRESLKGVSSKLPRHSERNQLNLCSYQECNQIAFILYK